MAIGAPPVDSLALPEADADSLPDAEPEADSEGESVEALSVEEPVFVAPEALIALVEAALSDLEVTRDDEPAAEPEVGTTGALVVSAGIEAAGSCEVCTAGCEVTAEGWPVTTPSALV